MVGKKREKRILRGLILRALKGEASGVFADGLAQRVVKVGVDEILTNEMEFTPTRIGMLARYMPEVRGRRGVYSLRR